MNSLRTPNSKFRGWIRQILNTNLIEDVVSFMKTQIHLLHNFYYSDSIFLIDEDVNIFVRIFF